jgi:class 3 adenylate cyclase
MEPHTYLPSYYQVGQKPVVLFCAEIREFDQLSEILRLRPDMERKEAAECLQRLVSRFLEIAAQIVEKEPYHGRVDQIWGNGLLVVFGEYLMDSLEAKPRVACMRATIAAAEFVDEFRKFAQEWLLRDFKIEKFQGSSNERITLLPAVAVDYGDVVFDYVGSSQHRVYMAIGDRVNFVKQLASIAGRTELDDINTEFLLRQLITLTRGSLPTLDEQFHVAPILLSQTAYTWSRHILKDKQGAPVGTVHQARIMHIAGKPTQYPVYELWPENVDRAMR